MRWEFGGDAPASYEPRATLTLNDVFAVCDAAIAGHGLVQLPTFIATPRIRNGDLVPALVDRVSAPAHLVLQYPARPLTPARVRVVVDFLYQALHDHPDLTFDPRRIAAPSKTSPSAQSRATQGVALAARPSPKASCIGAR